MAQGSFGTSLRRVREAHRRAFYGWWIVAVGTFSQAMAGAVYNLGFGAFFLPIASDLETTRTKVSGAFALNRLEGGLLGPIQGWLIDRFGVRQTMLVGYLIFGLGLVLVSRVHSVPQFYAAFAIAAVGASLSGFVPLSSAVVNWFVRKRALAVSIFMCGGPLGGLLVPLLALAIHHFGWRAAAVGAGVTIWLTAIPVLLVLRPSPEAMGMAPDGAKPPPAGGNRAAAEGLTVQQAMRTRAFWFLASAHSIATLAWSTLAVHQIPAMVDIGLSGQVAASMVGLTAISQVAGRLSAGILAERLGKKQLGVGAFCIATAGLAAFAIAPSLVTAVVMAVCFGAGFAARGVIFTTLRGDYFGRRAYATITGAMEPVVMIGTLIGPVLAGWTFDTTQSYRNAFIAIAIANLSGAVLLALTTRPRTPARPADPAPAATAAP